MNIAGEYLPGAAQDFTCYEEWHKTEKQTTAQKLTPIPGKQAVKTKVSCEVDVGESKFEAWVAGWTHRKYRLALFAKYFGEPPALRLDTGGRPHLNKRFGTTLPSRLINPPHFHRAFPDGILRAYHVDALIDAVKVEKILSDIQEGANLFCQESKLVAPNGGVVTVEIHAEDLGLSIEDPLSGTTFPP